MIARQNTINVEHQIGLRREVPELGLFLGNMIVLPR